MRRRISLVGHARTICAELGAAIKPPPSTPSTAVEVIIDDATMGIVKLRGLLGHVPGADTVVVIIPGITGSASAPYCARAAMAAARAGCAHFRIGMRGTDRSGEDIWHGGLTDDVHAAIAAPELGGFARIVLFGYSVGGHVVLRAATEAMDPRVVAVASVCAPLDLDLGTTVFDQPEQRIYRWHILSALNEIYAATSTRRRLPVPLEIVRRARSSRERDALAIAPRFGFESAEHYYARASVGPRLPGLRIPALVVATRGDPIVPPRTILPALYAARSALTVRWAAGGHVAFPADADLGFAGPRGMENQVLSWLLEPKEMRHVHH
jgi:predicted alpha/beta-fold hydrolase